MAYPKLVNFQRAKPLSISGLYVDKTVTPDYPYTNDSYYYYLIDNIPFVKQDNRDALWSTLMQTSCVTGFPLKGAATGILDQDMTPVIIDFQNGVIHREFTKQILESYEAIGFVLKHAVTNSTWYQYSGTKIYYVALNVETAIIPFENVTHVPNTDTDKLLLPYEDTRLFVDNTGKLCTSSAPNRMINSVNSPIPVGVVRSIFDTGSLHSFVCLFASDGTFGYSTGLGDVLHERLDDIKQSKQVPNDPVFYVYGHYGHKTKIRVFNTSLSTSPAEGDPVCINSSGSISTYVRNSTTELKPLIGFVLRKVDTDTTTKYYVVTDGEWVDSRNTFVAGMIYYLAPNGTFTYTLNDDVKTSYCKVGISLNTNTILLELESNLFSKHVIEGFGIGDSTYYAGKQVTSEVRSSGFPGHRRFLTNREGIGPFPMGSPIEEDEGIVSSFRPYATGWATGEVKVYTGTPLVATDVTLTNMRWGYAPGSYPVTAITFQGHSAAHKDEVDFGFCADSGFNATLPGVKPPKAGLVIQRLAPEYTSDPNAIFERFLVFMYADVSNIDWINGRVYNTADPKLSAGIPFTSAIDRAHTLVTNTTVSSTQPDYWVAVKRYTDSAYSTNIDTGEFEYVSVKVLATATSDDPNDFCKKNTTLRLNRYPTTTLDITTFPVTTPGISLKNEHGIVGLYCSVDYRYPTPTSTTSTTTMPQGTLCAFINYKSYEYSLDSDGNYLYKFKDCYLSTKDPNFNTSKLHYDRIVSFPVGGLSFDVDTDAGNVFIAGVYNSSPHHLNWLNKHKNSWWGWEPVSTQVPRHPLYLPAALGSSYLGPNKPTYNIDQSLFSLTPYSSFEFLANLKPPLNNQTTGASLHSYNYINFNTFYGNAQLGGNVVEDVKTVSRKVEGDPRYVSQTKLRNYELGSPLRAKLPSNKILYGDGRAQNRNIYYENWSTKGYDPPTNYTYYTTNETSIIANRTSPATNHIRQMFRQVDFSKFGIFVNPWSAVDKDTFWFGSPWNVTLGPTIRTGTYIPYHGYRLVGTSAIVYIYRGNRTTSDYVDISMDATALPFQVFANYANYTGSSEPTERKTFDFVTLVNGTYKTFGPGDTIRIALPPTAANDLRYTSYSDREISTRNLPALSLTYSSSPVTVTTTGNTSGDVTNIRCLQLSPAMQSALQQYYSGTTTTTTVNGSINGTVIRGTSVTYENITQGTPLPVLMVPVYGSTTSICCPEGQHLNPEAVTLLGTTGGSDTGPGAGTNDLTNVAGYTPSSTGTTTTTSNLARPVQTRGFIIGPSGQSMPCTYANIMAHCRGADALESGYECDCGSELPPPVDPPAPPPNPDDPPNPPGTTPPPTIPALCLPDEGGGITPVPIRIPYWYNRKTLVSNVPSLDDPSIW